MTAPGGPAAAASASASVSPSAPPAVRPAERTETLRDTLPRYRVMLHNDDVNAMDHVVHALLTSVPALTPERASEIMLEAHEHGQALVIICPLELAELYRERLESFGLTATIERV